MNSDRAGDTSQRCGHSPAFLLPREFSEPSVMPEVLTFEELSDLLTKFGFSGDKEIASFLLRRLNYGTIKQYCSIMARAGNLPLTLDNLHAYIKFDQALRAVLMKWIGVFELQFRATCANYMAVELGPFCHRNPDNFKDQGFFDDFLETYSRELNHKIEAGIDSIINTCNSYGDLPVWDAVEILPFGALCKMFKNVKSQSVRHSVADEVGVKYSYLSSWIRTTAEMRNRCAHFSPLTCKPIVSKPKQIKGIAEPNGTVFYFVLVLEQLTQTDMLHNDLRAFYDLGVIKDVLTIPNAHREEIVSLAGFPPNWKDLMADASTAIEGIKVRPKSAPAKAGE